MNRCAVRGTTPVSVFALGKHCARACARPDRVQARRDGRRQAYLREELADSRDPILEPFPGMMYPSHGTATLYYRAHDSQTASLL